MATEELPVAKRYTPAPYWGCPKCGANTWGAINPTEKDLVYECHGFQHRYLTLEPCGTKFVLPPDFYEEDNGNGN